MFSNFFLTGMCTLCTLWKERNFAHMTSFVILYLHRIIIIIILYIQKKIDIQTTWLIINIHIFYNKTYY